MAKHIRQKNSSLNPDLAYTVVLDPNNLYENHDSIIEHPDLFEVVDIDIPEDAQFLKYTG